VTHPAFHRAPRGRSFVLFTRPLVVPPCQLVQHARADPSNHLPLMQQEVDHRRQCVTGAGAFSALIQDLGHHVAVDQLVGERNQPGLIEPVANVDSIRKRIEESPHSLTRGCRRRRPRSRCTCGRPRSVRASSSRRGTLFGDHGTPSQATRAGDESHHPRQVVARALAKVDCEVKRKGAWLFQGGISLPKPVQEGPDAAFGDLRHFERKRWVARRSERPHRSVLGRT
jgi:hypothetical protein